MSDFMAKMHQIRFRLGLRSRPRWGSLQRFPRPLAGFNGPTSEGREGQGRGGEWRGGEEREGEGRGGYRGEEKGKVREGTGGSGGEGRGTRPGCLLILTILAKGLLTASTNTHLLSRTECN